MGAGIYWNMHICMEVQHIRSNSKTTFYSFSQPELSLRSLRDHWRTFRAIFLILALSSVHTVLYILFHGSGFKGLSSLKNNIQKNIRYKDWTENERKTEKSYKVWFVGGKHKNRGVVQPHRAWANVPGVSQRWGCYSAVIVDWTRQRLRARWRRSSWACCFALSLHQILFPVWFVNNNNNNSVPSSNTSFKVMRRKSFSGAQDSSSCCVSVSFCFLKPALPRP